MKRGQALVEFVIILPIFILLILGLIDIGNIIHNQNVLESNINDVISFYEENDNQKDFNQYLKNIDKKIKFETKDSTTEIEYILSKKIDIFTPGLNLFFKNPYEVTAKRVINNGNE